MQEQTPVRNRKKPINKRGKQPPPKKSKRMGKQQPPSKMKGMMMNNPYQNVPVKSNQNNILRKNSNTTPTSGFGYGGTVY